jgi:hypothetical protein
MPKKIGKDKVVKPVEHRGPGQPPIIKSLAELESKIDEYFNDCKGKPLLDKNGDPIINKYGKVILVGYEPLTITGLAIAIGFNSRTTLLNYQAIPEYMNTIIRAKSIVQRFAETSLYDRDTCNGAKFNLTNNFGWSDKTVIENTGELQVNTMDLSKFSVEQLKEMAKE